MGSNSLSPDELPVHSVTVPTFEMTATEVTVQQYGVCVSAGQCSAPGTWASCDWNDPGKEDYPVNCLDWYQAVDFCAWAGGRLPSESEWEYAARSEGQAVTYPWGNDPASCSRAVMDQGGFGCVTGQSWAVCSKVNGNTSQGLCDMAGNVSEWVQDWYHIDYTNAPTDGSAWESPSGSTRVVRGGGYTDFGWWLQVAYRWYYDPSIPDPTLGFRCAR